MDVAGFDFDLPRDLIAQTPPVQRGTSRLLVLDRRTDAITHTTISDLPTWLCRGDLLVVNDTRVIPARLIGWREPSGGAVECLLLHRIDASVSDSGRALRQSSGRVLRQNSGQALRQGSGQAEDWEALVHPGQKLKPGTRLRFGVSLSLFGEILEQKFYGRRIVRLWTGDASSGVIDAIERIGHVPLPPYIRRPDSPSDRERYQTVYARVAGSVAAPTAGLHFTDALLESVRREGIERAEITLHVGYGTFKPVRSEHVEDHVVDPEPYVIGTDAAVTINRALEERRRIVAVGTTTTRALEHAAQQTGGHVEPGAGMADVFMYPGFQFLVTQGLLTNFHLPRSSLLMLVSAFAGRERVLRAYREAIARRYRFYSYGDAMLIL